MRITSAHAIALTALVASVGGGFAFAHDADTDKAHFCVDNANDGNVRAVEPDGTCRTGETPVDVRVQNVAYQEATAGSHTYKGGRRYRLVSKQLLVPRDGQDYAISAKLTVSKGRGKGTRPGIVRCELDGLEPKYPSDRAAVTVRPGESFSMAFQNKSKTVGRAGQVAATEIACSSPGSRFTISDVKITALPVNTVSKGIPVG